MPGPASAAPVYQPAALVINTFQEQDGGEDEQDRSVCALVLVVVFGGSWSECCTVLLLCKSPAISSTLYTL